MSLERKISSKEKQSCLKARLEFKCVRLFSEYLIIVFWEIQMDEGYLHHAYKMYHQHFNDGLGCSTILATETCS